MKQKMFFFLEHTFFGTVFLEHAWFFDDLADVGILISGSSAFYKTSLNI